MRNASLSDLRLAHAQAARQAAKCPALPNLPPSQVRWPIQVFAPIVDVGLAAAAGPHPQYDVLSAAQRLGVKFFNLGFVTADPNGVPIFAGYRLGSPWDRGLRWQVVALRNLGGDVAISFGGANGADSELARLLDNVPQLCEAYSAVVDAYGLARVDFDIEESAARDLASIERRSLAVSSLQRARAADGRPLDVWFTLHGLPTGLAPDEINILESALAAGVEIAGVNMMTMNFGDAAAPNPEGRMGDYAISAARSLFDQLRAIFDPRRAKLSDAQIWRKIGITPMVGQNDTLSERFYQDDVPKLLDFAQQKPVGMVSLWSINRDANTGRANYDSTGIVQEPYEFTTAFTSRMRAS